MIHHHLSPVDENFCILCCPPIGQVSFFIVLSPLIIKAVSHLVSDYNSDSSVIKCIVSIHIEKRILQNTCGETNFICRRIVISIYRLRSHIPSVPVHRFAGIGNHIIEIEFIRADDIIPIRIVLNLQTGIIPPFIRISHFYIYGREFFQSFCFGFFAHPIQIFNSFSQSRL